MQLLAIVLPINSVAAAAADQARVFEHAQMFRHRRQRHRIRPRQIRDATVALCQLFQDAPARPLGRQVRREEDLPLGAGEPSALRTIVHSMETNIE